MADYNFDKESRQDPKLSEQPSLYLSLLSTQVNHTTDAPLLGPVGDVALLTKALDIAHPLAPKAACMATQMTGSICATPGLHLDLPTEEETTDQGTDTNPGSIIVEADTTRKVRKIHIARIIIKITLTNSPPKTNDKPSKPHARTQME